MADEEGGWEDGLGTAEAEKQQKQQKRASAIRAASVLLQAHKAHVVILVGHLLRLSRECDSAVLQSALVAKVPPPVRPRRSGNDGISIDALRVLTAWFHGTFTSQTVRGRYENKFQSFADFLNDPSELCFGTNKRMNE